MVQGLGKASASRGPAERQAEGASRRATPAIMVGLSESTIRGHLAHLKAAVRWAHKLGLLVEVPKFDLPRRAKKSGKASPMKGRPITAEEFERMLAKVPEVVIEDAGSEELTGCQLAEQERRVESWRHLLRGLWLSGLRLGEALNLTWDDDRKLWLDLSGEFPMMRIRSELEKANEDRVLPITPGFADFLMETPGDERTGPVFNPMPLSGQGGRLGLLWVSKVISAIGEAAGVKVATDIRTGRVKYASAHDCRRAFGERWASRVMPPILQQLMRHASIDTTLRFYVGKNADTAAAAVWQSVGRRLGNTSGHSTPKTTCNDGAAVVASESRDDT
jgi:integrase